MSENQIAQNNNNYDDETKSIILSLETLTKEYDTVLIKYNQAQKDYINYLKPKTTNNGLEPDPLIYIKGKKFDGTSTISEGASDSIEKCKAMCSSNSSCTGATYNLDKAYCSIKSGEGPISAGTENDYAIVPENLKYLQIIQDLTERLTDINQEIIITLNKGEPLYSEQEIQRQQQNIILNKNYEELIKEREKVEGTIKKYKDLDKKQNETNIFVSQKYLIYIFLIIIILIIVFLFVNFLSSTTTPTDISSFQESNSLNITTYIIIFVIFLITFIIWKNNQITK